MADPPQRVFINDAVCEGCGDCSDQSNCVSVKPLETPDGRKRTIDQSACNKDFSCMDGFCPSFVSVAGGAVRHGRARDATDARFPALPPPVLPATGRPWGILVTGVGGTGVVTIGALIGMAAHLDGKGVTVLDMTGLAQKGGSVFSHIRIAERPDDLHAVRIAAGEANAVIGGDVVVTASVDALAKMAVGRTRGVVNCAETPTSEFTRNPDWQFPLEKMQAAIVEAVGNDGCLFLDAQFLATRLLGDAIATNLFLLGYAWQKGWVPVTEASLDQAIVLNGAAVAMNRAAFLWGRRAAVDRGAVEALARPPSTPPDHRREDDLDARIARRAAFLTDYQDAAYARRYTDFVARVRTAEAPLGSERLGEAVADGYFRLLACKDEYEVARLFTAPAFRAAVDAAFEGDYRLRFHLAPTFLARPDPATGRLRKLAFGPWLMTAFRGLAWLRRLRGTPFDLFAYHPERKAERALTAHYEADIADLLSDLSATTLHVAEAVARLPETIRGYGHVKADAMAQAAQRRTALLAELAALRALRRPSGT